LKILASALPGLKILFPTLPGIVATRLHLHQAGLIEGTRVDVDGVAVLGRTVGQRLVVLDGLLHELCVVLKRQKHELPKN
jgi:hypothetical protein